MATTPTIGLGIRRTRSTSRRNSSATAHPIAAAQPNEPPTAEATSSGLVSPETCAARNAPASTIARTSVRADSSTRAVPASCSSPSCCTIGMTTADEVPPSTAPSERARLQGRPSARWPQAANTPEVIRNASTVRRDVVAIEPRSAARDRDRPLSKSRTVRAMVLRAAPALPKSAGRTAWVAGPRSRPITMSSSTSGMCVRRKRATKRPAASSSRPMPRMVMARKPAAAGSCSQRQQGGKALRCHRFLHSLRAPTRRCPGAQGLPSDCPMG